MNFTTTNEHLSFVDAIVVSEVIFVNLKNHVAFFKQEDIRLKHYYFIVKLGK